MVRNLFHLSIIYVLYIIYIYIWIPFFDLRNIPITGLKGLKSLIIVGLSLGYQLGEHGAWCKITNFELATRVPLIVSYPNQLSQGSTSMVLVEHLDIYPTLADIAGIPIPSAVQGRSLLSLMSNPSMQGKIVRDGFNASYSQITRGRRGRYVQYTFIVFFFFKAR